MPMGLWPGEAALAKIEEFQGFFSYARHDAETDPEFVAAFSRDLEMRVNGKLTNARFTIWHDITSLRAGLLWDERIGDAVRASRVLIVLLTPQWFQSEYCCKEYTSFVREVESKYAVGEYVFVILAKDYESQRQYFDSQQINIAHELRRRQYKVAFVSDFLELKESKRTLLIDRVAEDLEGMVQRLRKLSNQSTAQLPRRAHQGLAEAKPLPYNLRDVDLVSRAEVVIGPAVGPHPRSVFADIGFIERMYVQTERMRVVFGVQRCFLSIADSATQKLLPVDALYTGMMGTALYVDYKLAPENALTLCMTAPTGSSLACYPWPWRKVRIAYQRSRCLKRMRK